MNTKIFQDIGLTEGETKVYLALLRLGQTKTGALAKKAEVSSSKVYKILDRLEKKGLAGHIIKSKVKYYNAMEPNRVLEYIEDKQTQLEAKKEQVKKILPELEMERTLAGAKTEAVIYDGLKAIYNFYRGILDELKQGEKYYVLGATYGVDLPGIRAFFHNFHKQRIQKKIIVKMLANYDTKETLVKTTNKHSEVKFLPQYLNSNMSFVFYKDKTFIFMLTREPKGFLIQSKEMVNNMKSYFDTLWKIAKK